MPTIAVNLFVSKINTKDCGNEDSLLRIFRKYPWFYFKETKIGNYRVHNKNLTGLCPWFLRERL